MHTTHSAPFANRAPLFAVGTLAVGLGLGAALLPISTLVVVLVALLLLLMALCALREPAVGLGLALIAAPFAPLEKELFSLPIDSGQALLLFTLVCHAVRALAQQNHKFIESARQLKYDRATLGLLCAFIAIAIISFFPATDFNAWVRECLKWVEVAALYLIVANTGNRRAHGIILAAVLISGLVQGGLGLYQFAFRGNAPDHFAIGGRFFRAFGTLQQPNPFGGFMGMLWPVALGLGMAATAKPKIGLHNWMELRRMAWVPRHTREGGGFARTTIPSFIAIATATALIASWSRGAWLAAGVAAAGMAMVASRKPGRALAAISTVVILVLVFNLPAYLPDSLRDRLTGFTSQFAGGDIDVRYMDLNGGTFATIERLAHWQAAEGMITDHPWLGVGFGNYEIAYPRYRTLYWENGLGHAHNYYLNIWAETGILGLLTYALFWIYIITRTARLAIGKPGSAARTTNWLALGILGAWLHIAAHNIVDNLYVANMFLFVGVYLGLLEDQSEPNPP